MENSETERNPQEMDLVTLYKLCGFEGQTLEEFAGVVADLKLDPVLGPFLQVDIGEDNVDISLIGEVIIEE